MLLQEINYAPEPIAKLFLARLREWLDGDGDVIDDAGDLAGVTDRLRQVIGAMLKHGDEDTRAYVLAVDAPKLGCPANKKKDPGYAGTGVSI